MSKAMLIHTLSKSNCEFSKRKISQLLDETMKLIRKEVKKNKKFYYPTFGTFSLRSRKARIGRNPQTGESIQIKASKSVGFKPAKVFKASLK